MPSPETPARLGPPEPAALRRRASAGIKVWVQERARGTRSHALRMAPAAIAASLLAAALAPLVQGELAAAAGGGLLATLLSQLGQTGANYVTDALEDVIGRLRGSTPASQAEVRDAIAGELQRRLDGVGADGLRQEMSALLRAVNGVETALEAAFDTGAQALHEQLARALAEFGDLSDVVVAALDSLQRGVTELLHGQRRSAELDERVLLEIGLLRRRIRALEAPSQRREEAAGPALPPAGAPDGVPPYRGLAAFQVHDAEWFHGREALTVSLVNEVAERLPGPSLLMVVGASGAGKSSLLNAGLVPAVRDGGLAVPGSDAWPYLLVSPGASPVRDLAIRVATLAAIPAGAVEADLRADPTRFATIVRQTLVAWAGRLSPGGQPGAAGAQPGAPGRLILVVDQFEELFTQCDDEGERHAFVRALCAAAGAVPGEGPPPALVVLGLRTDFYTECTAHPELVALLEGSQVVVGPMTRDELRHAIERPAELAGITLEPGLVDVILHDLDARLAAEDQPGYDPGRLPLLSHALLATWERRRDGVLTVAGYHAAGGIERAVTTTANRLFEDLGPQEQAMAQQLLLRLVVVSESAAEDVRGRASRAELLRGRTPDAQQAILTALNALVDARLVTATEDSFEITHEALLRAWPLLRSWIEKNREWMIVRRHLSDAARDWQDGSGELYGRNRLARVQEQLEPDEARRAELDQRETAFLAESVKHQERTELRERRRVQVLRTLAGVLAVLLVVTAALAAIAYSQSTMAEQQRRIALSRQVAADADALRTTDPAASALLSVESHRIADTDEARSSVLSTQAPYYTALAAGSAGPVNGVAVSPDGRTLASAGQQGAVELWDTAAHQRIATLRDGGSAIPVRDVAFSPDGGTVAAAEQNGAVVLWDVRRRVPSAVLPGDFGAVNAVAFSPSGDALATGGNDGIVRLWDPAARSVRAALTGQDGPTDQIFDVTFSPDGRTIASAGGNGGVDLWSAGTGRQVTLGRHVGPARAVAFSPDGHTLASGGDDGRVRLWDAASGRPGDVLATSNDVIRTVTFSADGRTLAAGGEKGTVRLWDVASKGTPLSLTGPTASVLDLAFAPDGTLAAAEADATVGLWDLGGSSILVAPEPASGATVSSLAIDPHPPEVLATAGANRPIELWRNGGPSATLGDGLDAPSALAFSPDGRTLAAATPGGDVALWDQGTRSRTGVLAGDGAPLDAVAFSRDGRYLATAAADFPVRIWDMRTRRVSGQVTDYRGVTSLAFSPDGRTLASAGDDGIVLSSVPSGSLLRVLAGHVGPVRAVAFSPDGTLLASGGATDQNVNLWDAAHGTLIATLLGHTEPVVGVAFSRDGTTLASAGADHTVKLWRVADRRPLATLVGADVTAVAFSSDGHTLAGVDPNGTAVFWDTDVGRVVDRICRGHPDLTRSQRQQYLPADQSSQPVCP